MMRPTLKRDLQNSNFQVVLQSINSSCSKRGKFESQSGFNRLQINDVPLELHLFLDLPENGTFMLSFLSCYLSYQ